MRENKEEINAIEWAVKDFGRVIYASFENLVQLFHKTDKGHLDLQFRGLGEKMEELSEVITKQIGDYGEQGFVLERASKSASLRRKGAPINYDESFESQREINSD